MYVHFVKIKVSQTGSPYCQVVVKFAGDFHIRKVKVSLNWNHENVHNGENLGENLYCEFNGLSNAICIYL